MPAQGQALVATLQPGEVHTGFLGPQGNVRLENRLRVKPDSASKAHEHGITAACSMVCHDKDALGAARSCRWRLC